VPYATLLYETTWFRKGGNAKQPLRKPTGHGSADATDRPETDLAERGRELRESGLTVLRIFRVLKREFPHAERDELWVAAGADMGTGWPLWADRSSPKPAAIRNDPRK
jgi:hypothetical protein